MLCLRVWVVMEGILVEFIGSSFKTNQKKDITVVHWI